MLEQLSACMLGDAQSSEDPSGNCGSSLASAWSSACTLRPANQYVSFRLTMHFSAHTFHLKIELLHPAQSWLSVLRTSSIISDMTSLFIVTLQLFKARLTANTYD